MAKFIELDKKERKKLFMKVKEEENITWSRLYPKLGISRSMFYNYLSGKYSIPKKVFKKLQRLAKIKIEKYFEFSMKKYTENKAKIPKMDEDLAEIFGILNGDGYISEESEISIVISHLEEDYFEYLKEIFEKVFDLKFSKYKQRNRLKLRTYSKSLAKILNENFGLPRGKKLGKLKIPKKIYKRDKWLKAYIRGLFDTDGSIYLRRGKERVVEIISADPRYLEEIKKALNYLGFRCGISGKNLYIYRKNMISKFFKEIKPSNPKHLKKFKDYSDSSAGRLVA